MHHKSKGAERVYKALLLLGSYTILPEYHVGESLLLDYYVKEMRLGCEIQGSQHHEFTAFFHDTKDAFRAAQQRDRRKAELCEQQNITLISLDYPVIMASKSPQELLEIILKEMNAANGATQEDNDW